MPASARDDPYSVLRSPGTVCDWRPLSLNASIDSVTEATEANHANLHPGFRSAYSHDCVIGGESGVRRHRTKVERNFTGQPHQVLVGGEQLRAEAAVLLAVAEGVAMATGLSPHIA